MAESQTYDLRVELIWALEQRPENPLPDGASDNLVSKLDEARAREELRERVIEKLRELSPDETHQGRPGAYKALFPCFERYSGTVFGAYAQEGLSVFPTADQYRAYLEDEVIEGIVGQVLPEASAGNPPSGIWELVLSDADSHLHREGYFRGDYELIQSWRREFWKVLRQRHQRYELRTYVSRHLARSLNRWKTEWHQAHRESEEEPAAAPPSNPSVTGLETEPGKRGRPRGASVSKFKEALIAKAEGKTNREIARILYESSRVTDKQVACVTSRLREFVKKHPDLVPEKARSNPKIQEWWSSAKQPTPT